MLAEYTLHLRAGIGAGITAAVNLLFTIAC